MAANNKPLSRANSAMGANALDAVNVQVILRCRPPAKEEVAARTPQVVKCDEAMKAVTLLQSVPGSKQQTTRTYHFDKVFQQDTTQERLYSSAISSIVEEVLEGFNCTIFAYGQTGTGKTYTMTGDIGDELSAGAGVIPRAIHQIFGYLDGIASEYSVKCSYLELYNEELTDLLTVGVDMPKVRIMEDRSGVVLAGIEESIVKNSKEIFALLEQGSAKRRTAETLLNKQSSRSHSVFIVTVSVREVTPEGDEVIRVGKLYLVDLAGSENITRSGAVEQRAKEAGNINKSLLTLGRVITALVEGQGHVPYRDSKLTRLLRDSLGGKTKTCIIATIAPTVQCQEETMSTLDYAHRAKNIKNKPEVNAKISKTTHLKEMNFEIEKLKQMLIATREKNGVYVPAQQYEEECTERRQLVARVEEMEAEAEAVAAQHERTKEEWQRETAAQQAEYEKQLNKVLGELVQTREELAAAQLAIRERDYAIATLQRCEAALAVHAGALNETLTGAAADIALLFRRWDEKNTLEDSNLALVQELRDAAVQRLEAMGAAVSATAAAQAERFQSTQQLLAGFAERKSAETSRMQADMTSLQVQLDGIGNIAADAAAALEAAGAAGLAGLGVQQGQYLKEAQAAAAAMAEQLAAAYAALSASLTDEQQQLGSFLGEQRAAGEAVFASTQTIVSTARQQMGATQAAATATRGEVAQRLGAAAGAVDDFEASFLAKTQAEQAALVKQISGMLASFIFKAETEVKSAASGLRTQIIADQSSLEGALAAMEAAVSDSLEVLGANEGAAVAAHAAGQAVLSQGRSKLGAAVQASAQRSSEMREAIASAAAEAAGKLEAHSAAVASAVAGQTASLTQLAATKKSKCGGAVEAAGRTRAAMQAAAMAGLAADTAAGSSLGELGKTGGAALAGFAAEQQVALAGLSSLVQEQVEKQYRTDGNRGKVPAERQRAVPPRGDIDVLRAPAVAAVFAEFRSQLVVGGGPGIDVAGAEEASVVEETVAGEGKGTGDGEAAGPEDEEDEQQQEQQQQENADAGNTAAAGPMVPPLDTSALPALKADKRVVSPSALGKRARAVDGETPVSGRSPSKLRSVFTRHQQRSARGERKD